MDVHGPLTRRGAPERRRVGLLFAFALSAVAILGPAGACTSRHLENSTPAASASAVPAPELAPLGNRAEAVAKADTLSVQGTSRGGADGAKLLVEAANLRERIYRIEGVRADALEAIELLRGAA